MLYSNKKYKKGQLVTIDSKIYRIVDITEQPTCVNCPLRFSPCYLLLGMRCVKEVPSRTSHY